MLRGYFSVGHSRIPTLFNEVIRISGYSFSANRCVVSVLYRVVKRNPVLLTRRDFVFRCLVNNFNNERIPAVLSDGIMEFIVAFFCVRSEGSADMSIPPMPNIKFRFAYIYFAVNLVGYFVDVSD